MKREMCKAVSIPVCKIQSAHTAEFPGVMRHGRPRNFDFELIQDDRRDGNVGGRHGCQTFLYPPEPFEETDKSVCIQSEHHNGSREESALRNTGRMWRSNRFSVTFLATTGSNFSRRSR